MLNKILCLILKHDEMNGVRLVRSDRWLGSHIEQYPKCRRCGKDLSK